MSDKTTTVSDEAKPDSAMGRPRKVTAEMAERICDRLCEGETLRRICQDAEFPSRRTVQRWVRDNAQFAMQYAIARACALDDKCDEILDIIDGKLPTGSENDERVRLGRDIARCEQHWKHLAMVWPPKYGARGAGGMAELLPLLEALGRTPRM